MHETGTLHFSCSPREARLPVTRLQLRATPQKPAEVLACREGPSLWLEDGLECQCPHQVRRWLSMTAPLHSTAACHKNAGFHSTAMKLLSKAPTPLAGAMHQPLSSLELS